VIGLVQVGEQSPCGSLHVPAADRLVILIAWTVGDLLLEIKHACPSRSSRRCCPNSIVSLGMRAFVQPILEKQ